MEKYECDESEKPLIIVDGSNVAYGGGKFNKPYLWMIKRVITDLTRNNYNYIMIVDATLRHRIDDPSELEVMIRNDQIQQVPARTIADSYIIQIAKKMIRNSKKVMVLTNDVKLIESEELPLERIAFFVVNILDEQEILYEPPLDLSVIITEEKEDHNENGEADNLKDNGKTFINNDKEDDIWDNDEQLISESKISSHLLESFLLYLRENNYIYEGVIISFASLASNLHKKYDGNFNKKFGYVKPKNFAIELEEEGFITIMEDMTPLFIRIEKKTIHALS